LGGVQYCLMVPANRLGYGAWSGYQLKIIQEVITLVVFVGFAWLVLGEKLKWNYAVSLGGVFRLRRQQGHRARHLRETADDLGRLPATPRLPGRRPEEKLLTYRCQ
jgi:hypothetical protein